MGSIRRKPRKQWRSPNYTLWTTPILLNIISPSNLIRRTFVKEFWITYQRWKLFYPNMKTPLSRGMFPFQPYLPCHTFMVSSIYTVLFIPLPWKGEIYIPCQLRLKLRNRFCKYLITKLRISQYWCFEHKSFI